MRYLIPFIIFILSSNALAQSPLEVINELNTGVENLMSYQWDCNTRPSLGHGCPEQLKDFHDDVSSRILYTLIEFKPPKRTCLNSLPDSALDRDPLFLNNIMGRRMSIASMDLISNIQLCSSSSSKKKYREIVNTINTVYHFRTEQFSQNSTRILNAINEVDQMLGTTKGMDQIACNTNISFKEQAHCEEIKACSKNSKDKLDETADLTIATLKELNRLEKEKLRYINLIQKIDKNSRSFDIHTFMERRGKLEEMRDVIMNTIENLKATIPWIKGDHFKNIDKEYQSHKESLDAAAPSLAKVEAKVYKENMKLKIARQLNRNREILLNNYGQMHEGAACLKDLGPCDRYDEIKEKMEPVNSAKVPASLNLYYDYAKCLDEEDTKARSYNSYAQTAGELTLGFAVGGAGGVLRLGVMAAKVLKNGNRVKGIMATGALGATGASMVHQYDQLVKSCRGASKKVEGMDTSSVAPQCMAQSKVVNTTDYTSCIVNFTTMVISGGLSLKGLKPKRGVASKSEVKLTSRGVSGSRQELDELVEKFDKLTPDEQLNVQRIADYLYTRGANADAKQLDYLTTFALRLSKKKRAKFLEEYGTPAAKSNKHARQFDRIQVDDFQREVALRRKLFKKYNKTMPRKEAHAKARKDSAERSAQIKETRMGCRAKSVTKQHRRAGGLFSNVSIALGVGGTGLGFAMANENQPKDLEWMSKLGYEVTMAYFLSKIGAKIMKNPSGGLGSKYLQGNLNSAKISGIDVGVYSQIFDISEDEARDKLNRLKLNPEKEAALKKLNYYIDENNLYESFRNGIINNYRGLIQGQQEFAELGKAPLKIGEQHFEEPITEENLNDPAFQDKLIGATLEEMYDSERGFLNFGSISADRFAYDRAWNAVVGVPKAMALAVPMYYSLCMSAAYPVAGTSAAIGIQAMNQLFSSKYYYEKRKKYINQ